MSDYPHNAEFLVRVRKRMERFDAMPPEVRALIHEFGSTMVVAFLDCGVTKPSRIRHLIQVVREEGGSYANSKPPAHRRSA